MVKTTPVTVITGFLGSGKTTLLNHILTGNHGRKIAVIENEFGEVGVDDALLKSSTQNRLNGDEEIVEMNNGCICCTVRGDLIKFLTKLSSRKLDLVIIETTGLADPAPVAQTFFVDEKVRQHYSLDAILTVVDAKHIIQHLDEVKPEGVENESVEQIAFADIVLLNKIDLVSEEEKKLVISKIKGLNVGCKVYETLNSQIDVEKILGLDAFSLDRVVKMDPEFLNEDQEHLHDQSVSSVGFTFEYDLDMSKLEDLIDYVIKEMGTDLYRYKGVLPIRGVEEKFVFQGVHMLFGGQLADKWGPNEPRIGRFIFIGKNLKREMLTKSFEACRAKELRFKVGQKILANVEGGFAPGLVIAQWDQGKAYRVKIEATGVEVWAPEDIDAFIRIRK